jgi:hypothetical protein
VQRVKLQKGDHRRRYGLRAWIFIIAGFALGGAPTDVSATDQPAGPQPVQRLLDLSGLAWLGGDTFLTVHDAKYPDEGTRVRVSLLVLPNSLEGILWTPLDPDFPGRPSSDLESAARIPGTDQVLLVESGDNGSEFQRIFLAEWGPNGIEVLDAVDWSTFTTVFNVEGTAVAETGEGYLFIWAERNSGQQSTDINWTRLTLDPFAFDDNVASAEFTVPDSLVDGAGEPLYNRPVVGLDLDADGRIYAVAAFDPEGSVPDPDNGPFRSAVFEIGGVNDEGVEIDAEPRLLATVDGLKLESVAVREEDGRVELFIGSDDENYGGTLRPLPPP